MKIFLYICISIIQFNVPQHSATLKNKKLLKVQSRNMHRSKVLIGRLVKKYDDHDVVLGCTPRHAVSVLTDIGKAGETGIGYLAKSSLAVVGFAATTYTLASIVIEEEIPEPEPRKITAEEMSKSLANQAAKKQPAVSEPIKAAIKLAEEAAKKHK